jgi:hypothetical protein
MKTINKKAVLSAPRPEVLGATALRSVDSLTFEVWKFKRGDQGEVGSLGEVEMPATKLVILEAVGMTTGRLIRREIWAINFADQWWEVTCGDDGYRLTLGESDRNPPGLCCGACGRVCP